MRPNYFVIKPQALQRWLPPLLWALVVLMLAAHQYQFWQADRLDTNIMALLPEDEQQPVIRASMQRLTELSSQQIVVMVGAPSWDDARKAANLAQADLAQVPKLLPTAISADTLQEAVAFYLPWRDRLLTPKQATWLEQSSSNQFGMAALMQLYQPGSMPRLTSWQNDPLGLWASWWGARAGELRVRPRDGLLWVSGEGLEWVVLSYTRSGSPFAVNGDSPLGKAINLARSRSAQAVPSSELIATGIPLHAEAAAAQANSEITTIGVGSLLAILLLVWITFRSFRPIVLVALSIVIGCAAALSVTALLFDKVHLLTLVFGASLVGVSVDYGFHYFAARQGHPASLSHRTLRHLMPGLMLALLTSTLAYLALGLAPFPGLRQMAIFSVIGLSAAFFTVACWFPWLDRGELPQTAFARRIAGSLQYWPIWRANRLGLILFAFLAVPVVAGLLQTSEQDDLRQLQSSPPELIAAQIKAGHLLGLPSPAQFFLIEGDDAENVLIQEEALKPRLDALIAAGQLGGYRAVSDWLPSQKRQHQLAALTSNAEHAAMTVVANQTGETLTPPQHAKEPLTPALWLASPAAASINGQWLGEMSGQHYSILLLQGLTPAQLPLIAKSADGLNGIHWVDVTFTYSKLLARYRVSMTWLLLGGYLAVLVVLSLRFGQQAWRAWLPTLLGSLVTAALLGWLGIPLQLFHILAFVLLLGMGVDYGIFLLEHPGDNSAWLAITLASTSTLLGFGLLALSSTPALSAFGLTMLLGGLIIWGITPLLRLHNESVKPTSSL